MSLGEVTQISEGIYAYLQPDGSWYLNNTGFIVGEFKDLLDAERLVGNLYRAYRELDGGPPGAHLDLGPALADMVAYHGGPLTCHA